MLGERSARPNLRLINKMTQLAGENGKGMLQKNFEGHRTEHRGARFLTGMQKKG